MLSPAKALTNEQLQNWIDEEGGVESLIIHGLNDIPIRNMRTEILWNRCVHFYEAAGLAKDELMRHLDAR